MAHDPSVPFLYETFIGQRIDPKAPAANRRTLFLRPDGNFYTIDSLGVVRLLGGGGSASVEIGQTVTGSPGTDAAVTRDASGKLVFTIPSGAAGPPGAPGPPGPQGPPGALPTYIRTVGDTPDILFSAIPDEPHAYVLPSDSGSVAVTAFWTGLFGDGPQNFLLLPNTSTDVGRVMILLIDGVRADEGNDNTSCGLSILSGTSVGTVDSVVCDVWQPCMMILQCMNVPFYPFHHWQILSTVPYNSTFDFPRPTDPFGTVFLGESAIQGFSALEALAGNYPRVVTYSPDGTTNRLVFRNTVGQFFPISLGSVISSGAPSGDGIAEYGSISTGSLADGATANISVTTMGRIAFALRVGASHACWVRVYGTSAQRTADNTRTETDPIPDGNTVQCDIILPVSELDQPLFNTRFQNDDSPRANVYYLAVKNKSGGVATITLEFDAQVVSN